MAQDRQKQRNQLIHQALLAAVGRVEHSTKSDDIFAPIGELVFWIVAADGVLEKQQGYEDWRRHHQHGHLLFGIRYVRNKVAHESEAWDYESKDVYTDRYTDRYGSWTWVQLPRPGPKDRQHWHVQYAAYKTHLLGQPMIDTTMNAVDLLEDWGKQNGIWPTGPPPAGPGRRVKRGAGPSGPAAPALDPGRCCAHLPRRSGRAELAGQPGGGLHPPLRPPLARGGHGRIQTMSRCRSCDLLAIRRTGLCAVRLPRLEERGPGVNERRSQLLLSKSSYRSEIDFP